jgi:hypothetical protein
MEYQISSPTHFCDSPKKNIVKELEVATKLKKFI